MSIGKLTSDCFGQIKARVQRSLQAFSFFGPIVNGQPKFYLKKDISVRYREKRKMHTAAKNSIVCIRIVLF